MTKAKTASRASPRKQRIARGLIEAWGGMDVIARECATTTEQVEEWVATGEIWRLRAQTSHLMHAILKLAIRPEGGAHA